jgi:peroxiredoxin
VTEQRLTVGSLAPDFTLTSGDREQWTLRGVLTQQVAVLVFYLWDFSRT